MKTENIVTYVAFHAAGTGNPILSDIKYYYLMKAWLKKDKGNFNLQSSHDLQFDSRFSGKNNLGKLLKQRLSISTNFLLILSKTTRKDNDWIPWEIEHAIDNYNLPVICTYPGFKDALSLDAIKHLWPDALRNRIMQGKTQVLHIPFQKIKIASAIQNLHSVTILKKRNTFWKEFDILF